MCPGWEGVIKIPIIRLSIIGTFNSGGGGLYLDSLLWLAGNLYFYHISHQLLTNKSNNSLVIYNTVFSFMISDKKDKPYHRKGGWICKQSLTNVHRVSKCLCLYVPTTAGREGSDFIKISLFTVPISFGREGVIWDRDNVTIITVFIFWRLP